MLRAASEKPKYASGTGLPMWIAKPANALFAIKSTTNNEEDIHNTHRFYFNILPRTGSKGLLPGI